MMMGTEPTSETTLAIIFGASRWPDAPKFGEAPAFERSANALINFLREPEGLALPWRNIKSFFNSFDDAAEQLEQATLFVERHRRLTAETDQGPRDLLVFYVGHGDFEGEARDFYLSILRTHQRRPLITSITARELGNFIRRSAGDLRAYLVMDCCFAAAVQHGFMTGPIGLAELKLHEALPPGSLRSNVAIDDVPTSGVALLAAAGLNKPALAPSDHQYTAFTTALLDILKSGHPRLGPRLSLENLHLLVERRLSELFPDAARPELRPLQQSHGRVERVEFFPNQAFLKAQNKRLREVEEVQLAEQQRKVEEAARLAEEQRKAEEAARLAEEQRRADEAARLAEERRKADDVVHLAAKQPKAEAEGALRAEGGQLGEKAGQADGDGSDQARLAEEKVDDNLASSRGSILWNMANAMRVSRRERVEVRIGDERTLENQLRAGLKGKGLQRIDQLNISRRMRVSLLADEKDFSIKILSNLDQYVREAQVARWDYDVMPLRSGKRVLRILVTMRLQVDGKEEVVDIDSYEREVAVRVAPIHTITRFVRINWQWIAGTIVVPLVVWMFAHTEIGSSVGKKLGMNEASPPPKSMPFVDWSQYFKPVIGGSYLVVSDATYNYTSIDQEITSLGKIAIRASKCFSTENSGWRLLYGAGLEQDVASDVVKILSSRGLSASLRFVGTPAFKDLGTLIMCW